MKWRIEYKISDAIDYETGSSMREWRLYIEGIEATELLSMVEARLALPPVHPAWEKINWIFKDTHERLMLLPYKPFDPCFSVTEILGPDFIDRVLQSPVEKKVWVSTDGWTWLHLPGDDAR